MPFVTEACPLCGAPSLSAFSTTDLNRHIDDRQFHYRRCRGCGVIFLANVPADLGRYYQAGYHRVPEPTELDAWAAYETYKLDVLRSLTPAGRVLDIGSSYGAFAYLSSRAGYDVTAIEIDPDACAFIENVIGVPAIRSSAPEEALDPLSDLDVITLWHSIEHLSQPWRVLQSAASRLRPGGKLLVATPNPVGFQARLLKDRWTHIDAPRHVFLIPRRSLVAVARSSGLTSGRMTSTDIETRRLNRTGWQRGLAEFGVPGAWGVGVVCEMAARPLERGLDQASAYLAVFER